MWGDARPAATRRWLAAAVAAWSLAGGLGACAGRRPAAEVPATRPAPPVGAAPLPTPAPTPTPVPPAMACVTAGDCALTPYPRLVASANGCYCPACPQPRNAAAAAANEEAWQRLCGVSWADQAGCLAPMCARPLAPACLGGACRPALSDSEEGAPPG